MSQETATFGGGCFWCTEAIFTSLKGVSAVVPGYAGGRTLNPTYEEVCSGTTGHAESIQITFDPEVVPYTTLVEIFFGTHNPTTINRQGNDIGEQYRSVIFTHSPEQEKIAKSVIAELDKERVFEKPVVTEVTPFTNFFPAEDYHRNYYAKNPNAPYCQAVISPKLATFRSKFRSYLV